MLTNFNIVQVPFQNKIKAKRKIKGIAFYFFNSNWTKCYYQMPYLLSGQYRPNDQAMMNAQNGKGTKCWQVISQDRKALFPEQKENFLIQDLTSKQIKQINAKIWKGDSKISTILNLDRLLSGSNPSGAEKNFASTPFLTKFESTPKSIWPLNFLVFTNVFKHFYQKKTAFLVKIQKNFANFSALKQASLSLETFLETKCNRQFLEKFYQYNRGLLSKEDLSLNLQKKLNFKTFDQEFLKQQILPELKSELKSSLAKRDYFLQTIETQLPKTFTNKQIAKTLQRKLRFFFKDTFTLQKKILQMKDSSFVIKDHVENVASLEIAHIFSVRNAWLAKDYKAIADYNNGILISANLHTLFDKNKCYLATQNKKIYFFLPKKKQKMFIEEKWIVENNFQILKYVQKYQKYLKIVSF